MSKHYALWLTGIIALVYGLQMVVPGFTDSFKLISADAFSRPWILFTAIFLHGSITHLLFNGFGLALFGSILEETIGSKRFLMVFFGTGLFSSVVVTFFYHSVLGASGAIYGILGTLVILRPTMTVWVYYMPMPLFVAAFVWAAGDLLGFLFPRGIANAGHLSGMLAGFVAGFSIRGKNFGIRRKGKIIGKPIVSAKDFDEWEKDNMGK
jgi:uncharacterized protein